MGDMADDCRKREESKMDENFVVAAVGFRVGSLTPAVACGLQKRMIASVDAVIGNIDGALGKRAVKIVIHNVFDKLCDRHRKPDFVVRQINGNPWVIAIGENRKGGSRDMFDAITELTRLPMSVLKAGKVILER